MAFKFLVISAIVVDIQNFLVVLILDLMISQHFENLATPLGLRECVNTLISYLQSLKNFCFGCSAWTTSWWQNWCPDGVLHWKKGTQKRKVKHGVQEIRYIRETGWTSLRCSWGLWSLRAHFYRKEVSWLPWKTVCSGHKLINSINPKLNITVYKS